MAKNSHEPGPDPQFPGTIMSANDLFSGIALPKKQPTLCSQTDEMHAQFSDFCDVSQTHAAERSRTMPYVTKPEPQPQPPAAPAGRPTPKPGPNSDKPKPIFSDWAMI